MVGSCTGLFLIAIIFEFLKVFRDVKTQGLWHINITLIIRLLNIQKPYWVAH